MSNLTARLRGILKSPICIGMAGLPNFFKAAKINFLFFLQAEDGIRDLTVTGVQTCALPISMCPRSALKIRACQYRQYPQSMFRFLLFPPTLQAVLYQLIVVLGNSFGFCVKKVYMQRERERDK